MPTRRSGIFRQVPSLRTQLVATMVGLVVLTALAVGLNVYLALTPAIEEASLARTRAAVLELASQLRRYTQGAQYQVEALRNAGSTRGYIEATASADKSARGLPQATWQELLEELFAAQIAARPAFLQLRLIDSDGRELVRVDRVGKNAPPRVTPPDQLQDKSARAYVDETLALATGEIYVSPIDLNREFGVLEVPDKPVLRVATPVDAADGTRFGLLIVNLDMSPILQRLRDAIPQDGALYLVNADGDFLVHPDRAREFGFDRGTRHSIADEEPALARALGGRLAAPGLDGVSALMGSSTTVAAAQTLLAGSLPVVLVETRPDGTSLAFATVRRSALTSGALAAVLAALLALVVARFTARPIVAMTRAVEAREGSDKLPQTSGGEVGVLARALAHYIDHERWHGAILDNSNEAILTTTPEGRVTSLNASAERLLGLSPDDAVGSPIEALLPEGSGAPIGEMVRATASGATVKDEVELTFSAPGGAMRDVRARASPVRSASGRLLGTSVVARDVTAELAALEAFRLATEWSPAAKILVDRERRIRLVNAELERRFGYSRDELLGRPFDLLVPDSAGDHPTLVDTYFNAPKSRAMQPDKEVHGRRKDGSFFAIEVTLTPVPSREGTMVLAAIVDVSELKRALGDLQLRSAQLERSNNDLTHFAHVASHDLQEPLRAVSSFAQLLADRYRGQLDERADGYIDYIVGGARRMRTLINELLVFSRLENELGTLQSVPMDNVLQDACRALDDTIARNEAVIETKGSLPVVNGNPAQLTRLLQNLIANAIKYRRAEPPAIRISARQEGGMWCFSIIDNGIGFEGKYKESIFTMFQRLHVEGSQRGSGLGLAIAKRIVEQHGGRIWADGRPGDGATFTFTLPVSP